MDGVSRVTSRWFAGFLVAGAALFMAADPAPGASCVLPPGLVAWWPGDGSGSDLVGTNHLTLLNGASFGPGQVGQAFAFDGVDDRAQLPDVEALKLDKSLTIESWVYLDYNGSQAFAFILFRGDDRDGLDPYFLATVGATVYFRITSIYNIFDALQVPMPTNRWTHVAATLDDATGQMGLYVDGALAAQKITSIRPFRDLNPASNPGVGIGNTGGYPATPWQFPFRGRIDELSVYDRALTASEIAGLAAAGTAGKCKTPVMLQLNGHTVGGSSLTVTNSATVVLSAAFSDGTIFYSLNGSAPGLGSLYSAPLVITQSVVLRAIAYDADFAQSGELAPLTITVVQTPRFTLQPVAQSVVTGGTVEFLTMAAGSPPLALQWYRNGVALPGATSSNLVVANVQATAAGNYWAVATNPYGALTSTVASLTVLGSPAITSQPTGLTTNLGESVTFCVTATGSPPLTYQWRINGVNIPGATNSCVTITNLQPDDAGAYNVLVANPAGVLASAAAVLVIEDFPAGPPASDSFAGRFELFGSSGNLEVNNIGATRENGEPTPAGKRGGASVWYRWTAPTNGIARFSTTGSAFDTLLGVYRGTNVTGLTVVESDEDRGGFLTSELRFNAVEGVEYNVLIDGLAAAQGDFVLVWNLEATAQVLPVITNAPVSQTVALGATAIFSVTAGGSGLRYQWFQNGVRLTGGTNATFIRTNVQAAHVGYYTVAITNSQQRGLVSLPASLEIGPFPTVRSVDKVEDLLAGTAPFLEASGAASVSIGSLGTQILNTTNSTTSFRETNHCGVIGGSSRWFQLHAGGTGTMAVDTFNSAFDTVLAVYVSSGTLGSYPSILITCNDDAGPGTPWSRVTFLATNGTDYYVAVDGPGGTAGPLQLNWALGVAPVIPSNAPAVLTPLVEQGGPLSLQTVLTNGVPPPRWQWYRDGTPLANATNRTLNLTSIQSADAGTYTVVANNALGAVTGQVARVSVEVPLHLTVAPAPDINGVHYRLRATITESFLVQWTTNFLNWLPLHTNLQSDPPLLFDDYATTNRARRFYRATPFP